MKRSSFLPHIKIKKHGQARHLKLRIDPVHKIPVLTVPLGCRKKYIEAFLQESQEWLEAQQAKGALTPVGLPGALCIRGKEYTLSFQHGSGQPVVEEDPLTHHLTIQAEASLQKIVLIRHLKEIALTESKDQIHRFADQLLVKVRKIGVKEYRSRWGCCYKRGDIYLSWRLIMAPFEVFRYVCAHETAHLLYRDHGAQFWQTVASIFPGYQSAIQWLRKNGAHLFQLL